MKPSPASDNFFDGLTLPQAPGQRETLTAALRDAYQQGKAAIRARFFAFPQGFQNARENARLIDQLLTALYPFLPHRQTLAIAAVGGYGRGQLSPYSDIDLMFLTQEKTRPHAEEAVQFLLYCLWDLGLQVGHSLRTPKEAIATAREDIKTATNLLDARLLAGDELVFSDFTVQYLQKIVQGKEAEFIAAKLTERNERHQKMGDSRFVLEPNIKEGKGGLRDLHTLWWIASFTYRLDGENGLLRTRILTKEEYRTYTQAREFLLTVRACMHYLRDRPENLLTFDLQREVAETLGYRAPTTSTMASTQAVERFMKHYFLTAKHVGNLTRTLCALLEAETSTRKAFPIPAFLRHGKQVEGFAVEGQRLILPSAKSIAENPVQIFHLFRTSQQHGLDIHPRSLRFIQQYRFDPSLRTNPEANRLFLEILTHSSPQVLTLKRMNEVGLLGKFLPDFGRIVGQMQFDMYHTFTVDEHTLNAIGVLGAIARGDLHDDLPLSTTLINTVPRRHVLYLAVLLHDVAKGRGGNHSEIGESIVRQLCPRLGLNAADTDTVAWLVRQHLLFSQTAFKRDLADPETLRNFIIEVQSVERLNLLLLLTVADIRAVGPKIWNGWKGALMRELYQRAATAMGVEHLEEDMHNRLQSAKQAVVLGLTDFPEDTRTAYLATTNPAFWLGFDTDHHLLFAQLLQDATHSRTPVSCHIEQQPFHALTRIILCSHRMEGLLARLSGACASAGLSIVSARSYRLSTTMALTLLGIQTPEGTVVEDEQRLARLLVRFNDALSEDKTHVRFVLPPPPTSKRLRAFVVEPSVIIDNGLSTDYTVVEITARDRLGLLYDIAQKCSELGLSITNAHISTYGEKAVDVFYVQNIFGLKILEAEKLTLIQDSLLATVKQT